MENRAYALAAGLFTLLLGVAVIATALWFGGEAVESRDYLLVSRYPVSGLNPQAPVRYRGVTVGKVVNIRFDPLEPRTILIQISVETGTPLTQGTYAKLGSQGVTGLSYVTLDDDGSKTQPLASPGDEMARIEVRQSFMDSVTASGEELISNFNQVAKQLNVLLSDDNQKQLLKTLRNVDVVSARVTAVAGAMEPTIKALPGLVNDTGLVLKRADAVLANVNQRIEAFERAANSTEQLGNNGVALSELMMSESLPRLNILLEDMQRSSRTFERLLYDINEQPHSFVFGRNPVPPGPGEPGFGERK